MRFKELDKVEEDQYFTGEHIFRHPDLFSEKGYPLLHPLLRSICSRVEYHLITRAEEIGERIISEMELGYGSHVALSKDGITLNWEKMSKVTYIPKWIIETQKCSSKGYTVFAQDEGQGGAITDFSEAIGWTHKDLTDKVLRHSEEKKIRLLVTDQEWRDLAKLYTKTLITKCRACIDLRPEVDQNYSLTSVVRELIDLYISEMKD